MSARPLTAIGTALLCALALTIPASSEAQSTLPKPFVRLGIWAASTVEATDGRRADSPTESRWAGGGAGLHDASGAESEVEQVQGRIVQLARQLVGTRYRLGGTSPERGFDCSGLVKFIAATLGMELPRTADQQSRAGLEVVRDPGFLRPGDILTFGRGQRVTHVGIYVGDGKFIHASSVAGRVVESRVDRPLVGAVRPWTGIRRVILASDAPAAAPRG